MLRFSLLDKTDFNTLAKDIFYILDKNMSGIVPTGNEYEEDYKLWVEAVGSGLKKASRQVILIYFNNRLIGFFQYYTNDTLFMMEEVQILPAYQGKEYNIFRKLFGFIFTALPIGLKIVEAYANKQNPKSQAILLHLGLHIIGENRNGNSYHFQGNFCNLTKWYD